MLQGSEGGGSEKDLRLRHRVLAATFAVATRTRDGCFSAAVASRLPSAQLRPAHHASRHRIAGQRRRSARDLEWFGNAARFSGMVSIRDKVGHFAVTNSLCVASEPFSAGEGVIERSPGPKVTYGEQNTG
jgi:hypothetical protein